MKSSLALVVSLVGSLHVSRSGSDVWVEVIEVSTDWESGLVETKSGRLDGEESVIRGGRMTGQI